jgi:hypothetical protein
MADPERDVEAEGVVVWAEARVACKSVAALTNASPIESVLMKEVGVADDCIFFIPFMAYRYLTYLQLGCESLGKQSSRVNRPM